MAIWAGAPVLVGPPLGDWSHWSGFNSINPQAGQNHFIVISVLVRDKKLAMGRSAEPPEFISEFYDLHKNPTQPET